MPRRALKKRRPSAIASPGRSEPPRAQRPVSTLNSTSLGRSQPPQPRVRRPRRRPGCAPRSTRSSRVSRTFPPKRCRTGWTRPPIGWCAIMASRRAFDFAPLSHEAVGERLGMMDFARAGKLSGSRFVVLRSALARLERALGQFMLDLHTTEFGYTEVSPPLLVRDDAAFGVGQLPKFAEDMFRTTDRVLVDPDRRGAADQPRCRRNPRRGRPAAALYCLDPMLSLGGRCGGQGHPRHDPPASISRRSSWSRSSDRTIPRPSTNG